MNIGIDFRLANCSHRGMARYCREIVRCLLEMDRSNHYILFIDESPTVHFEGCNNYSFCFIHTKNYIIGEQIYLPLEAVKMGCDVLWCPYNTFPIFLPLKIRLLVTIHDVIFFYKNRSSRTFYQHVGGVYRKCVLKLFYKRINSCVTVSAFSKNEILKYIPFKIPIKITYNCVNSFSKNVEYYKKNNAVFIRDYFFTVSGDAASKNLDVLIDVFKKEFPNETLVIGGVSKKSTLRANASSNIIFLDEGVSDNILIRNYLECKCFLFCSKYEGFGIPIIEAAICGKPIIASNTSSIPEILGEKGILVEPSYFGILEGVRLFRSSYKQNVDYSDIISKFNDWHHPATTILNSIVGVPK